MNHVFAFVQKCERSEKSLRLLLEQAKNVDGQTNPTSNATTTLDSNVEADIESNSGQCSPNIEGYQSEGPSTPSEPNTNDIDEFVTKSEVDGYSCINKIEYSTIEYVQTSEHLTASTPVKCKTNRDATSKAINDFIAENTLKFICNHCKASFSSRRSLNLHENSRKCLQQSYECDICHKVFIKKRYLIRHLQRMHRMLNEDAKKDECTSSSSKRKYKCHLCPKGRIFY